MPGMLDLTAKRVGDGTLAKFISEAGEPDGTGRASVKPMAGTEFDVPADVAAQLISFGMARAAHVTERAVKPKGETADRK